MSFDINRHMHALVFQDYSIPFYCRLIIAPLIHYPCTTVLPALADWSAILEWVLPTM